MQPECTRHRFPKLVTMEICITGGLVSLVGGIEVEEEKVDDCRRYEDRRPKWMEVRVCKTGFRGSLCLYSYLFSTEKVTKKYRYRHMTVSCLKIYILACYVGHFIFSR